MNRIRVAKSLPQNAAKRAVTKRSTPKRGLRQPELTRANILRAATDEFASKGLAGARVDKIAARAGCNKRMIYEYFGNKEALWIKVLESTYEAKRREEHALDVGHLTPVDGIRALVRLNFRYCINHPEFVTLLSVENLHRARYLRRSKSVPKLYSPQVALIADLLRRGVDAGLFRTGVDPLQLYLSILSLCTFYFTNQNTLSAIFNRDLATVEAVDVRESEIAGMVLAYLGR